MKNGVLICLLMNTCTYFEFIRDLSGPHRMYIYPPAKIGLGISYLGTLGVLLEYKTRSFHEILTIEPTFLGTIVIFYLFYYYYVVASPYSYPYNFLDKLDSDISSFFFHYFFYFFERYTLFHFGSSYLVIGVFFFGAFFVFFLDLDFIESYPEDHILLEKYLNMSIHFLYFRVLFEGLVFGYFHNLTLVFPL